MTDKADKVHPVVEAMARAIAEACGETHAWVAHIEPAKAAAKVLIEECAEVAEQEHQWRDYDGKTLIGRRFLTGPEAAKCIRSLKTELGLEG